jgi:hypothetical protein
MQITDSELNEFITIYRETYHQDISIPEARSLASDFLELMKIIVKPIGDTDKTNKDFDD